MHSDSARTLGKYQLQERLGRGGMAEVYKAHHPGLDRLVAVKILHPHLADTPNFIDRFRREARAIARLRHPHIVQVFDFDVEDEEPYMVMEYVEGRSLKELLDDLFLRGERWPVAEVLDTFRPLLEAVAYAHEAGMVHRDLKPANVMLDAAGRPVLTDFGIAKMVDAAKLTASGATVGTPAYMSPEQGQGNAGDARSDIYALGVMLYECLAGTVPYDGDSSVAILLKHIGAPVPSLRQTRPELSPALDGVVAKAMAKKPGDRFQSAREMLGALTAAATGGAAETAPLAKPESARPAAPKPERPALPTAVQWPRRTWYLVGAAAIVILLVVGLGRAAVPFLRAPSPAQQAVERGQAQLANGEFQLAADSFTAALDLDLQMSAAYLGRAEAYEQLGLIFEAYEDVEQYLELAPDGAAGYAERARLGVQYGLEPDPARVLEDFDRAVELAPESARVRFLRGWAVLNFPLVDEAPDPQRALGDLQAAAKLEPQMAEAHFAMAQAFFALQNWPEALTAANRAVELEPDSALHRKLRAHTHALLGDFHAAADDLLAAARVEQDAPLKAVLYAEHAYLNIRLRNRAAAQADVDRALALDPDSKLAGYVQVLLDPSLDRPGVSELREARAAAPEDPIWQAIIQDLLAP